MSEAIPTPLGHLQQVLGTADTFLGVEAVDQTLDLRAVQAALEAEEGEAMTLRVMLILLLLVLQTLAAAAAATGLPPGQPLAALASSSSAT